MEKELAALRLEVESLRLTSNKQEKVIQKLKNSIHGEKASSESYSDGSDGDSEGEQTSDGELPKPMWDGDDDVFRCSDCDYEVIEGECIWCGLKHQYDEEDEDALEYDRSVQTDTTDIRSARLLAQRSMTPLRTTYEDDRPPSSFKGTREEYTALLQRGATRLMIATFHMDFKDETGIIAWADQDLYELWTTDIMKDGDYWKLMLGRRIKLSPDDPDGSEWIGDFLEDAFVTRSVSFYETVEESAGIWVTRPTERGMNLARWSLTGDESLMKNERSDSEDSDSDTEMAENDEELEETIGPINYEDDYESEAESAEEDLMYVAEDEPEENEEERKREAVASDPTMARWYFPPSHYNSDSDSDSDMAGSDWNSDETLSGDEAVFGRKTRRESAKAC
ncbi:hypothetical protein M422DRAFT_28447 [Sphaerobolus stellatus SS14]|nr:hypothetical protein M422DRAFT_28447 [Sphaerobolus stellatus SS14]